MPRQIKAECPQPDFQLVWTDKNKLCELCDLTRKLLRINVNQWEKFMMVWIGKHFCGPVWTVVRTKGKPGPQQQGGR